MSGAAASGRNVPRAYAQFKLTPAVNIYVSAAKGFRSGGFNNVAGEHDFSVLDRPGSVRLN